MPRPFTYTFGYDAEDRLLSLKYPDGGQTDYAFDALGRLISVSDLISDTIYDNEGRREKVVYSSGYVASYAYDAAHGRLNEHALTDPKNAAEIFRQRFEYDRDGNVLSINDVSAPGPNRTPGSAIFGTTRLVAWLGFRATRTGSRLTRFRL